jgi:hypothetical protein
VAAESVVRLLARNQQEVPIGKTAAPIEVHLLFLEANGAGILGMRVGVEIRHVGDVDAQAAKDVDPSGMQVDGSGIVELFQKMHVEVADHHLVAGHGLVAIVVREA